MRREGRARRRRAHDASGGRFIPFYVPLTDERDVREAAHAIRSGWLTTGPKVGRLEERIANRFIETGVNDADSRRIHFCSRSA